MKIKLYLLVFLSSIVFTFPLAGQKSKKTITLSGYVTDADKKPVPGIMILIDNENTNIITNKKGYYKLRIKPKASTISILTLTNGVLSEDSIKGRTSVDFVVSRSVHPQNPGQNTYQNNEEVNVGYGSTNTKDLTTTVNKIDGRKSRFASYQNIYQMIAGEVPGVQVSGSSIKIQGGPTSFSLSSEPLFVIDGVVANSIDNITPQMVKSISILKGGAASIYGSRATNGVILIDLIGAGNK
jgi:TonB-dependent SusC/RagA subfamily outer membrane receptor